MFRRYYCGLAVSALCMSAALWPALSPAGPPGLPPTSNFGPYNVNFLEGGVGLNRPLSDEAAPLAAGAPWTICGWLRSARRQPGNVIVAAIGTS